MRRTRPGEWIADGEDGVYIEDGDMAEPRIVAYNEGGYNSTEVFVSEVLAWARKNRPDLLADASARILDEAEKERAPMTPRQRAENCVHELGVYDASSLASATELIESAIGAAVAEARRTMTTSNHQEVERVIMAVRDASRVWLVKSNLHPVERELLEALAALDATWEGK